MIIRVKIPLIIEVKNIINKNKGGDLRFGPAAYSTDTHLPNSHRVK